APRNVSKFDIGVDTRPRSKSSYWRRQLPSKSAPRLTMKIPHSRPILLSFGLASTALVMCALLLLEWQGGTAATESFEWVSQTLEVQRELATVEARMSEAEASQRGYLLTANSGFLLHYGEAKNDVRSRVSNL